MKHKHAELIKAWADGAKIQIKLHDEWYDVEGFIKWYEETQYRIKPEPKPDVVSYGFIDSFSYDCSLCIDLDRSISHNVKFIFNGETGKLKSAEVIK
jgi:hypothetical protein